MYNNTTMLQHCHTCTELQLTRQFSTIVPVLNYKYGGTTDVALHIPHSPSVLCGPHMWSGHPRSQWQTGNGKNYVMMNAFQVLSSYPKPVTGFQMDTTSNTLQQYYKYGQSFSHQKNFRDRVTNETEQGWTGSPAVLFCVKHLGCKATISM
jgi:hypothetical protein